MAEPFRVVTDEADGASASRTDSLTSAGMSALMLGLRALSQRALIALSACFTLLTVASAFWLFMSIHDPNTMQLIEMGMYGCFVLLANFIVRRV